MLLKIGLLFASSGLTLSIEVDETTALVNPDQAENGELFIKNILDGKGMSGRPKQLMFTAPFKLCDGGRNCSSNNFAMVFPLYVGKTGEGKYKQFYSRDYNKTFNGKLNAPFKRKPTKYDKYTLCPLHRLSAKSTNTRPPTTPRRPRPNKIRGKVLKDRHTTQGKACIQNRKPSLQICCPKYYNPYWMLCK